MGTVVKAYKHGNLASKPIALKIVRKEKFKKHPKFEKWMHREIKVHKYLSDNIPKGVVNLYDVLENDKYIVMVMELCELRTIVEYMYSKPDERLSEEEARYIF